MSQESVVLQLPEKLIERIREVAEQQNQPLENVMVDSLTLLFGGGDEVSLEALDGFSDEQLWAVVHRRLAWPHDERLRELAALNQQGRLTKDETVEIDRLVAEVDRYVLLRSKALLLLKQRGHDIENRLRRGA